MATEAVAPDQAPTKAFEVDRATRRAVKAGASLTWNDVVVDETSEAVRIRREMEESENSKQRTENRAQ